MRLQRIQYGSLARFNSRHSIFIRLLPHLRNMDSTAQEAGKRYRLSGQHKDGKILKVQLTPRLIIKKKWRGKDIFVIFPVRREGQARRIWYLVCRDSLIKLIGETRTWLSSKDWRDKDLYSCPSPPEGILNELRSNVLVELS